MKRVIFISTAIFTTTAIFLFRHGRKEKHHPPIMKFNDLYRDNNLDDDFHVFCPKDIDFDFWSKIISHKQGTMFTVVQKLNGGGKYGVNGR